MENVKLLEAKDLTVHYGLYQALGGVSVSFDEGEFVSIIGPNGAGKTTLVNVLTGHTRPSAGTVRFRGRDIAGKGPVHLSRLGMARSFQLVNTFPNLNVREAISVAVTSRRGCGYRWLRSLSGDHSLRAEVEEIAGLFQLAGRLEHGSGTLSQGEKKLLDVASAFALRPEVILLDEPTSGVSTAEKHTVMKVMVEAAKRVGVISIIQIEHDMDLVFGYSDRIIAIHQGVVIADATPANFRANADVVAKVMGKDLH